MTMILKTEKWTYFPSKSEWDETDKMDRIRQSARLLLDSLDRHNVPVTDRIRIAITVLSRALREENTVD